MLAEQDLHPKKLYTLRKTVGMENSNADVRESEWREPVGDQNKQSQKNTDSSSQVSRCYGEY